MTTRPRFGIAIVPSIEALEANRELVRAADAAGLDLVGVQDHPYQRRFLDTWSLIATLITQTQRVAFFTDVANLPLRPPAVMAKAAATLDLLSGGRFELGLGAGGIPDVIANFGGPRRTPGEAVEALDEAIDVIRLIWSAERSVSFEGEHYRLNDARPGPRPAHEIAIWVGAFKPRMLRLVGRKADGWLPSLGVLSPHELRAAQEVIDTAARKAGRDPRSIRRILNLQGVIGNAPAPPRSSLPVGYLAGEPLAGPPEWWIETLSGFVADGFDTLIFWPVDPTPEQVERFAATSRQVRDGHDGRGPVDRYFEADARRDIEAIVALFTDDAVVLDERRTWSGREAIRAWQHGPASRYRYTTHLAGIARTGAESYRATGHLEGNFPGGTAVLNWDFTLAGDRITRLEIAP